MRFGYIARLMGRRPHKALAPRHLRPYRLIIACGGSIAAVYSRLPWPLDYKFAPNRQEDTQNSQRRTLFVAGSAAGIALTVPTYPQLRLSASKLQVPDRVAACVAEIHAAPAAGEATAADLVPLLRGVMVIVKTRVRPVLPRPTYEPLTSHGGVPTR